MSQTNGAATSILRLGQLTPARKPIEIERDGETVTLQGFVFGKRCPGTAKAEASAALTAWKEAEGDVYAAHITYKRDTLLAVVPGLTFPEADVLSDDDDEERGADAILRYLGWITTPSEDEESGDPEASGGETSTTDLSSPTSAAPTAEPPSNG